MCSILDAGTVHYPVDYTRLRMSTCTVLAARGIHDIVAHRRTPEYYSYIAGTYVCIYHHEDCYSYALLLLQLYEVHTQGCECAHGLRCCCRTCNMILVQQYDRVRMIRPGTGCRLHTSAAVRVYQVYVGPATCLKTAVQATNSTAVRVQLSYG